MREVRDEDLPLSTIDSFGSARGATAHRAVKTQQPPDPANELANVSQIIAGLRQVDALLSRLRSE